MTKDDVVVLERIFTMLKGAVSQIEKACAEVLNLKIGGSSSLDSSSKVNISEKGRDAWKNRKLE